MNGQMWLEACVERIRCSDAVSDRIIEYFTAKENKYIFGTNRQAAVCLEICRYMQLPVKGVIQTSILCDTGERKGYWKELMQGTDRYSLEQVASQDKDAYILMAVGQEHYEKAEIILKKNGLHNIYRCEWRSNTDLRMICYEVYKEKMELWTETQQIECDC